MDAAFFQEEILDLLARKGCEYAIKVGFWKWVGLKPLVAAQRHWTRISAQVSAFETATGLSRVDQAGVECRPFTEHPRTMPLCQRHRFEIASRGTSSAGLGEFRHRWNGLPR